MKQQFDPARIPISARGSWMSIALDSSEDAPRGGGLYLRTNRYRPVAMRHIFRVVPITSNGDERSYRADGRPGLLEISDEGTPMAEIAFDGVSSIRIRSAVPIRLESAFEGSNQRENARHAVAYPLGSSRFVVNAKVWLRRYGIAILQGSASLEAPWDGEISTRADITVVPDETGVAELAVDEFSSTWIEGERRPFDAVCDSLAAQARHFTEGFLVEPARAETVSRASSLIWMCTQSPSGLMSREAIFMSLNWMDSVWSWDNWINMAPLTRTQPELAYAQVEVIAEHQDEFGAYPDALNDGFLHFNFAKPPVQGLIADRIEQRDRAFWSADRRATVYQSLARFTMWWLNHRRFEGSMLCHYLHGNDSGWDNGTLLREGVPVVTPDLNAFLVRQCRTLARWATELGEPAAESGRWTSHGDQLLEALVSQLWREDHFVAIHVPSGDDVSSQSLAAALPLVIADELPAHITSALIEALDGCTTRWGLASEAPSSPNYEAENYWRGPIWAPTTLIAVDALRRIGHTERADRISRSYMELVERGGFAENFHAETGAPLVDPGYTWTAAVYLLFAEEEAGRPE